MSHAYDCPARSYVKDDCNCNAVHNGMVLFETFLDNVLVVVALASEYQRGSLPKAPAMRISYLY